MSIYSDLKKAILLLEHVEALQGVTQSLEDKVSELAMRVVHLEAREDAIILGAEKAARNAAKAVVEDRSNNSKKLS